MLEAVLLLSLVRITPEKVKDFLVILRMVSTELDLKWSLDLLNSLNILNGWTDSSVAAKNSLLFISNNSCEWHLLECLVDLGKHTVWIIDVFS